MNSDSIKLQARIKQPPSKILNRALYPPCCWSASSSSLMILWTHVHSELSSLEVFLDKAYLPPGWICMRIGICHQGLENVKFTRQKLRTIYDVAILVWGQLTCKEAMTSASFPVGKSLINSMRFLLRLLLNRWLKAYPWLQAKGPVLKSNQDLGEDGWRRFSTEYNLWNCVFATISCKQNCSIAPLTITRSLSSPVSSAYDWVASVGTYSVWIHANLCRRKGDPNREWPWDIPRRWRRPTCPLPESTASSSTPSCGTLDGMT